ncbi:MAG TPA: cation-transporting P-type ATPase [Aromatoleum sp.]|uniref:cation-translocating P-type ATPase n=1 Tax=Aromatoleum sp. TaxID=2307007 RepID=UPI002B496942|nr:cation-transporting P-type ATPase [Aromatoleum sp.]HJV25647.1 cation-transporting P-type ATPase [Aromatoleum sp.]
MRIHQLSASEALASLHTGPQGLAAAEAARRLREYGLNRIEGFRRAHPLADLLKAFTPFFSVVLWIASGLAFLLEREMPGQGMTRLGYAIVGVIVVSGLFTYWQEFRAERTLAALLQLLPDRVRVLRDGCVSSLGAEALVPGDVILLQEGDRVPADCRVVEAFGARVNTATVTGESLPRPCEAERSNAESPSRSPNVLLAGTSLVAGKARAVVFATGMRTEFGSIAHLAQAGGEAQSPLRRQITHLSRLIIGLALGLALLFLAIGWGVGIPLREDLTFAVGIIIAMVPEGLLPTLTLALALASQRMAKRQVLIRHLPAVEALGSTTVICTDKTGTLTQNRMTVNALYLGDSLAFETAGNPLAQLQPQCPRFFEVAALCHDLPTGEDGLPSKSALGDPMEIALVELARAAPGPTPKWRRLDEIPFDASRMRLTTLHDAPQGAILYCKGAPETVLLLCTRSFVDGRLEPLSEAQREAVRKAQTEMAGRGLRVLAFAWRPPDSSSAGERLGDVAALERELVFAGLAGLEDPPRPEVPAAIRKCREAGIKVIMVTGDHPGTAVAVGRAIGLVCSESPVVVTGERLHRLSDTQLQLALDAPEIVFSRVGPDQKMRIVEALKRKREIVAVTGDGVNDAPALKSAHIGVAMGCGGTDVAREAADIVLMDDNFASIVAAIEEGRAVFDNIRKFLTYILAHNVPELVPYLAFALFKVPLALTPIQILAIDMGTESLTALGLGVEAADPRIMQRPPRRQNERLLDRHVALRAYLFLGLIEAVAAMSAFFVTLLAGGWANGEPIGTDDPLYLRATTACLIAIVILQMVNVFLCRSPDRSVLVTRLGGNRLIAWGIVLAAVLILMIVYLPAANAFFGTAAVGPGAWLFVLPFAAALVLLEELRKWIVRRRLVPKPES